MTTVQQLSALVGRLCCFAGIRDYLRHGWGGSKFRAAASAKRIIGRREIAQEAAHLHGFAHLAGG